MADYLTLQCHNTTVVIFSVSRTLLIQRIVSMATQQYSSEVIVLLETV